MKKALVLILALCLMAGLCACGAAPASEKPSAAPAPEATAEPTAALTPEPVAESTAPAVNPYAWLGYDELPVCEYLDGIASQVYYCEYDLYALGYVSHSVEALDGVNIYRYDGMSGILTLNLEGKLYNFSPDTMKYWFSDATETYKATLEQTAKQMEQGIARIDREFKGTGSEPIPQYCDNGDTASYEYYELFTDGQSPLTQRIYFKDGDVFAIYTSVATGENQTQETTQVITAFSASPDPALFALPENFDEYTLQ